MSTLVLIILTNSLSSFRAAITPFGFVKVNSLTEPKNIFYILISLGILSRPFFLFILIIFYRMSICWMNDFKSDTSIILVYFSVQTPIKFLKVLNS